MTNKNKSILVVDDDEDILRIVNKILKAAGFMVHLCASPAEARKILERGLPHLIISDLNMEPEDGFSFIRSLRQQKELEQIPIVVLSSINQFNPVKRAISLGITDYVVKPIQASVLLSKVRKALHRLEAPIWVPPKGEGPEVEIRLEAEVIEIGETGYRLAGPFKVSPGKDIKIECPEFTELGIDRCLHQSSRLMKIYLAHGRFSNDVTLINVTEQSTSRIRKLTLKAGG